MSDPDARECPHCEHIMHYDPAEPDVGLDQGWRCTNPLCGYSVIGDWANGILPSWLGIKTAATCSNTAIPDPKDLTPKLYTEDLTTLALRGLNEPNTGD